MGGCYHTKVTVKVTLRKILSINLVIFVAQDMELKAMNLMIIWIYTLMPRKQLREQELVMRGHVSISVLSSLPMSLWFSRQEADEESS